ncbi:hypothetical protein [Georgenia sp. AZ-5]
MDMWLQLHEYRARDLVTEARTAERRRGTRRARNATSFLPPARPGGRGA